MVTKFFNTLLIPFLILVQINTIVASNDDANYDSSYDVVYSYLENARRHVQDAYDYHLPVISGLPVELIDLGDAVITVGNVHIQVIINGLTEEINGLTQEAKELGVDLEVLENCIQTYSNDLNALSENAEAEIYDCVEGIVIEGLDIIQDSLKKTDGRSEVLTTKQFRMEECRGLKGDNIPTCLVDVLIDLQQTGFDIYSQVYNTFRDATYAVRDLEDSLGTCTLDGIGAAQEKGTEIVNLIRVCANLPAR